MTALNFARLPTQEIVLWMDSQISSPQDTILSFKGKKIVLEHTKHPVVVAVTGERSLLIHLGQRLDVCGFLEDIDDVLGMLPSMLSSYTLTSSSTVYVFGYSTSQDKMRSVIFEFKPETNWQPSDYDSLVYFHPYDEKYLGHYISTMDMAGILNDQHSKYPTAIGGTITQTRISQFSVSTTTFTFHDYQAVFSQTLNEALKALQTANEAVDQQININ